MTDRKGGRSPLTIDVHQHLGDLTAIFGDAQTAIPGTDDDERDLRVRVEAMDLAGIDHAVLTGSHLYLRPNGLADTRALNDRVAALRDRSGGRIVAGVGIVEPLYGEAGYDEIERCAHELGFVGLSFHVRFQGVSLDNPWVHRYTARAAAAGLVLFVQVVAESAENALWKLADLAEKHPDAAFLALDAFTSFGQTREATQLARRHRNIWFDTSLLLDVRMLDPFIETVGVDRLVYGTDLYSGQSRPRGHIRAELLRSGLGDDDVAAILATNACTLLNLEPLATPGP